MNVKLLNLQDTKKLEEYLSPHKAECMFICNNLKAAGIEYKGNNFEGEYFGYFNDPRVLTAQLLGVIVHYSNGNIIMHSSNQGILEQLICHLKNNLKRPIVGVSRTKQPSRICNRESRIIQCLF